LASGIEGLLEQLVTSVTLELGASAMSTRTWCRASVSCERHRGLLEERAV
jgi:hypothetical protein